MHNGLAKAFPELQTDKWNEDEQFFHKEKRKMALQDKDIA